MIKGGFCTIDSVIEFEGKNEDIIRERREKKKGNEKL